MERYKSDEKRDWYEACESCQRRIEQKIETESVEFKKVRTGAEERWRIC